LRVQLQRLEAQSRRRTENATYLSEGLSEVPGLDPVRGDERVTVNAYHLFRLWYGPTAFGGRTAGQFAKAMVAEGVPISPGYPAPLSQHPVVTRRVAYISERLGLGESMEDACPVCADVCERGLWLRQSALLGSREQMDDIVQAARKVVEVWGT